LGLSPRAGSGGNGWEFSFGSLAAASKTAPAAMRAVEMTALSQGRGCPTEEGEWFVDSMKPETWPN